MSKRKKARRKPAAKTAPARKPEREPARKPKREPAHEPNRKTARKPDRGAAAPKRKYPMPCPRCRKMIDATDKLCPYCGVDTDEALWAARAVFPFVAVGLVILIGALLGRIPRAWAFGLIAGTVATGIVFYLQRKRSH